MVETKTTSNKPAKTFKTGLLEVSLWKNTGPKGDFLSMNLQRSYKDPKTNEWRHTQTYRINDIPVLQMLLGEAFAYAKTNKTNKNEEEN